MNLRKNLDTTIFGHKKAGLLPGYIKTSLNMEF